jgi:hypothetical protein
MEVPPRSWWSQPLSWPRWPQHLDGLVATATSSTSTSLLAPGWWLPIGLLLSCSHGQPQGCTDSLVLDGAGGSLKRPWTGTQWARSHSTNLTSTSRFRCPSLSPPINLAEGSEAAARMAATSATSSSSTDGLTVVAEVSTGGFISWSAKLWLYIFQATLALAHTNFAKLQSWSDLCQLDEVDLGLKLMKILIFFRPDLP